MPGKIISLVNFKGGVGKTTLTVNLAACLAKEHGKKVLILDLDPQSNSSIWLMGPALWSTLNGENYLRKTSAAMFCNGWEQIQENIFFRPFTVPTGNLLPNLYLSPASLKMLELELSIVRFWHRRKIEGAYIPGDEYFLFHRAARLLRNMFDFVLIDCPPNLYFGTCNVLCHSDYILIPSIPDTLSTCGLKMMIEQIEQTMTPLVNSQRLSHTPVILAIAITRFEANTNEHRLGVETVEQIIGELRTGNCSLVDNQTAVFHEQPIKKHVVHAEAVQEGAPLCFFAPGSSAYNDIKAFTQKFLTAIESRQ